MISSKQRSSMFLVIITKNNFCVIDSEWYVYFLRIKYDKIVLKCNES